MMSGIIAPSHTLIKSKAEAVKPRRPADNITAEVHGILCMNHLSSYEKCSRTNSHSTHHALRLIKLFFSEVEPHYFSTTWESLYPVPWEILQQLLNPSILQAPCFHCSTEPQSLVLLSSRRWQACANSAAMSCGGWFLRSLFNWESAHEEKALLISTG